MDKLKEELKVKAREPQTILVDFNVLAELVADVKKIKEHLLKPETANGYPLEPGYVKPPRTVTKADVYAVKAYKLNGKLNQKQIALKVDLSEAVVSKIINGDYDHLMWR